MQNNIGGWFEIPVSDMQRAMNFYQKVFDIQLELRDLGVLQMAIFPGSPEGRGASGALVYHADWYKPSADGILLYLNALSGDLTEELNRVAAAGGTVLIAKRQISAEAGFMAVFNDSEGNRIALHSMK